MRQYGATNFNDTLTVDGSVTGVIETGVETISVSVPGLGSTDVGISLSKDNFETGCGILIVGTSGTAGGNDGVYVQFITDSAEGDGLELVNNYGRLYSKHAGASLLSGAIYSGVRLNQAYIDNTVPEIVLQFYNINGTSTTMQGKFHWVVFQS